MPTHSVRSQVMELVVLFESFLLDVKQNFLLEKDCTGVEN
jgi:hypothetical protein